VAPSPVEIIGVLRSNPDIGMRFVHFGPISEMPTTNSTVRHSQREVFDEVLRPASALFWCGWTCVREGSWKGVSYERRTRGECG
jgi:hypothetical protein